MQKTFIITDPCYVMDDAQYRKICEEGADFEHQWFPMISKHRVNGNAIVFLDIQGTGGDGSMRWGTEEIGVDSGMLAIVECAEGWKGEKFGATFATKVEAGVAFGKIMRGF